MKTLLKIGYMVLLFVCLAIFGNLNLQAQTATGNMSHILADANVQDNNPEADPHINTSSDLKINNQVQKECLISLWNHRRNLDASPLVKDLGFNLIWSHDQPYTGQAWEETHMYKLLSTTGVKYVFAKIERAAWGWSHEQSLKHAVWVAKLSMEHPGILGMYLNDFYDEVEEGHRTEEQWREIIKAAKDINLNFQLWVPHYPHRNQGRHAFDFDIDGVILNLWGNKPELMARAREHIEAGLEHHPDRQVIAGLYLRSGSDGGRWLSEKEFKDVLGLYVELVNEGKLTGLRIFSAGQLLERPEYQEWAKEILSGLKCP
ncbi:hypothetical protein ACFLU5_08120 [Bacteroidota bacterium]